MFSSYCYKSDSSYVVHCTQASSCQCSEAEHNNCIVSKEIMLHFFVFLPKQCFHRKDDFENSLGNNNKVLIVFSFMILKEPVGDKGG